MDLYHPTCDKTAQVPTGILAIYFSMGQSRTGPHSQEGAAATAFGCRRRNTQRPTVHTWANQDP